MSPAFSRLHVHLFFCTVLPWNIHWFPQFQTCELAASFQLFRKQKIPISPLTRFSPCSSVLFTCLLLWNLPIQAHKSVAIHPNGSYSVCATDFLTESDERLPHPKFNTSENCARTLHSIGCHEIRLSSLLMIWISSMHCILVRTCVAIPSNDRLTGTFLFPLVGNIVHARACTVEYRASVFFT